MKRLKLFAGIDLDDRTRLECDAIAKRLRAAQFVARYEPAEKLHVTLAFLGWIDPKEIGQICAALQRVARRFSPFSMTLDRLGAFPHERKPRVVWIGSHETQARFAALAAAVRDEYCELGFTFQRAALAHVTVARAGNGVLSPLEFPAIRFLVRQVTLFESLPASRTTRYEVVTRAMLARKEPSANE